MITGYALLALMLVTYTDQTVQVHKGARLEVTDFAGEVTVKVWNRDAVRVESTHSDRETVEIDQTGSAVSVRGRSRTGPPRSLDYAITMPAWMPISVSGTYVDVTLEGVGADVTVETTRGDISVRGGSGLVSLKSVSGRVSLEHASGHVEVRTVNDGLHLADVSGDVTAETVNGGIVLDRVDSANVDAYTVNGDVWYDGPIRDKGLYRLTTHNGRVGLPVAEKANATIDVRTYNGRFTSTFPVKIDDERRRRFTLVFGDGSARVELESFAGTIALWRPGEPRPHVESSITRRPPRRDRDR